MARDIHTVIDGMSYTEGPRWHDNRIWFSDFYLCQVFSAAEDGGDLRTEAEVAGQPSGLGWLPDGRLLVVSQLDHRVLRREPDGVLSTHADLSDLAPGHLNDMVVDGAGHAYVGNFGFDLMAGDRLASTVLLRVDPDGSAAVAADDMWFPNGSVVTPSGQLLVNETFGNRVTAFDITADGSLANRRVWASFGPLPRESALGKATAELAVAPDGCALDAEGCLWVADAIGGRAIRVREGGEILDDVQAGTGVFACALGGADGRTLFLSAAPDFLEANRRPVREATVLATRVGVPASGH